MKVSVLKLYVISKGRVYVMVVNVGLDLEVFGKVKFGFGSFSKEWGDCVFLYFE